MAEIVLQPGEKLTVTFSDTDGRFFIEWTDTELRVSADIEASHIGKAGLIWREVFDSCTCDDIGPFGTSSYKDAGTVDPKCPTHGKFGTENIHKHEIACECGIVEPALCPIHGKDGISRVGPPGTCICIGDAAGDPRAMNPRCAVHGNG